MMKFSLTCKAVGLIFLHYSKNSPARRLYKATLAQSRLEDVYATLRANFTTNADELAVAFSSVCDESAELLSPDYLVSVGSVLCKLGKTDPSQQWLERWKNDNLPRLSPTELYELLHRDLPNDLRQAIQEEMDKRAGASDLPSILRRLLTGAMGRNDLKNLATASENDFYQWMVTGKDNDVISTIRHLFETFSVATEPEASIRKKIVAALRRIENTDPANKIRVSSLMRKLADTEKTLSG